MCFNGNRDFGNSSLDYWLHNRLGSVKASDDDVWLSDRRELKGIEASESKTRLGDHPSRAFLFCV